MGRGMTLSDLQPSSTLYTQTRSESVIHTLLRGELSLSEGEREFYWLELERRDL